jgi:hypothetical protein
VVRRSTWWDFSISRLIENLLSPPQSQIISPLVPLVRPLPFSQHGSIIAPPAATELGSTSPPSLFHSSISPHDPFPPSNLSVCSVCALCKSVARSIDESQRASSHHGNRQQHQETTDVRRPRHCTTLPPLPVRPLTRVCVCRSAPNAWRNCRPPSPRPLRPRPPQPPNPSNSNHPPRRDAPTRPPRRVWAQDA